jgi:CxxC-x17-CxxC domain-containing protein
VSFEDKNLTCRECGQTFVWTAGEQAFYAEKGLVNVPSRCPQCRASRRATGSAGSSSNAPRPSRNENRVQHPVTCASCGKETTVPFVPKYDRPVYCSDCFDQQRAGVAR